MPTHRRQPIVLLVQIYKYRRFGGALEEVEHCVAKLSITCWKPSTTGSDTLWMLIASSLSRQCRLHAHFASEKLAGASDFASEIETLTLFLFLSFSLCSQFLQISRRRCAHVYVFMHVEAALTLFLFLSLSLCLSQVLEILRATRRAPSAELHPGAVSAI